MRAASVMFLLGGFALIAVASQEAYEGKPVVPALYGPLLMGVVVSAALASFMRSAALATIGGVSAVTIIAATSPGPSFPALVAGALMCAIGAYASLPFTGVHSPTDPDVVHDDFVEGRRYVYKGNRIVAIEIWKDGACVLTTPVVPRIARR